MQGSSSDEDTFDPTSIIEELNEYEKDLPAAAAYERSVLPPIVHSILGRVVLGGVCLLAQCMWQTVLVRCVFWLV